MLSSSDKNTTPSVDVFTNSYIFFGFLFSVLPMFLPDPHLPAACANSQEWTLSRSVPELRLVKDSLECACPPHISVVCWRPLCDCYLSVDVCHVFIISFCFQPLLVYFMPVNVLLVLYPQEIFTVHVRA